MMAQLTVIRPRKGLIGIDMKELYSYRELLWSFTVRNIKVRYKQTVIGGFWAILQPFLTMVVFTIFFGKVAKIPSEGVPYAIFSYSGLLLWTYFSNSVSSSSTSLVSSSGLISKIYFPRIILPLSFTMVRIIDYSIAWLIMAGLMAYYRFVPPVYILLLPLVIFFTWMFASGIGFWLSAMNVKYRDVGHAVPFLVQLMMFMTPVIYPVSIAGRFKVLLMLNPITGFIEAHRAMILGHQAVDFTLLGVSVVLTLIVFITGLMYFRSVERYFADVI
ncbi:MAG: ABC transporter permease [Nanoarchaeota archaeon]|nr:ABC transporter permease [Nanoarchaeota archaeon]